MDTGENSQGLRKIMDFTRLISITMLIMHFYLLCYPAFSVWDLTTTIVDRLMSNLSKLGVFKTVFNAKAGVFLMLIVSQLAVKGKKEENINLRKAYIYIAIGLMLYCGSSLILVLKASVVLVSSLYMCATTLGYLLVLSGTTWLARAININLSKDVFNTINETFPQEERLLENEYSINLPSRYNLRGKMRNSWINIINPFRGLLIAGNPGAGKSYFIIRHIIAQHIRKGFSMLIYDFKFDDLSMIAYNALLKDSSGYKVKPRFYVIDLDKVKHRCNPLEPGTMLDVTDAAESARTIMLGLNREWIKKQGDFFVESPINFLTAIIWYLKKYESGKYCTLPHAIELMQVKYDDLFRVMQTEPEIQVLINPFVSAHENQASEQLEGQIGSAKISMARLSSPALYYVLSGNDFTLDLNNPLEPKIICLGNNPQKLQVYGAVLSLFISRAIKLINQKDKLKSSLIFDEFPTIFFNGIDNLMATARSNKVATTLAVQDFSQLKKDYGREQAEVIMNIAGNVISGQVTGDTAKQLSERFGKIIQQKKSISVNSSDTSVSSSTQLDSAVPASTIASLSSGEFVGVVADDPDQKISLKSFHCEIINDHQAIKEDQESYRSIPDLQLVSEDMMMNKYHNIRKDINLLVEDVLTSSVRDEKNVVLNIGDLIPESRDPAVKQRMFSLLSKISESGGLMMKEIMEILDLNRSVATKDLKALKASELLKFNGPTKTGKYMITERGASVLQTSP
jgi:predicted transcriptional regulator